MRADFERSAHSLRDDLQWFAKNIENWQRESLTPDQSSQLNSLREHFEHSKMLVSKMGVLLELCF